MKAIEKRVLELIQAVVRNCRIFFYIRDAIEELVEQGFGHVSFEFVIGIYNQLEIEVKKTMKIWSENASKKLYWEFTYEGHKRIVIWSERYLMRYKHSQSKSHVMELVDTWNDKSTEITIEKSADVFHSLCPLDQGFGLLVESADDDLHFVSLVALDFYEKKLEKRDTIEVESDHIGILVNNLEQTEFVLHFSEEYADEFDENFRYQICKIVGNEIVCGEIIELDFHCISYSDGYLYCLDLPGMNDNHFDGYRLRAYNIEQKSVQSFDLGTAKGYGNNDSIALSFECIRSVVFIIFPFLGGKDVIAYVDLQTREWTMLGFKPNFDLRKIKFLNGKDLVISSHGYQSKREYKHYFYKLSVGKPDLLQNMAWKVLVDYMKRIKHPKGPYEAARKYLPYNSKIRCPFVKPEPDEKSGPRDKRVKLNK